MRKLSVEELTVLSERLMAEKNAAIRLGIKTLEPLIRVYPNTELARCAKSIMESMQEAHDLKLSDAAKNLVDKWAALAESNTVPNSPPVP